MTAEIAQIPTQESPVVPNINDTSLQVTLPQMLALALGTPEVGAVNFNILHNFLHVLLHQLNLQDTKVEFRGENADHIKMMVNSLKPSLHEDGITDVTEALPGDIELPADTNARVTTNMQPIVVEAGKNGTPNALRFNQLEQSVQQLQEKFQALEQLSETPEIMEHLKEGVTDPMVEMWKNANLKKQLDANEQDINKLKTIMQDIIGHDIDVIETVEKTRLDDIENKISKLEQKLSNLQKIVESLLESASLDVSVMDDLEVKPLATDKATIPSNEKEETDESPIIPNKEIPSKTTNNNNYQQIRGSIALLQTKVAEIQMELQDLNERITKMEGKVPRLVNDIDTAAVKDIKTTFDKALYYIIERADNLKKNVDSLLTRMDSIQAASIACDDEIKELNAKMQQTQMDMEKYAETTDKLIFDKENQETQLKSLLEEIELLKAIKADKEDLEDALADKADTQVVNRKVSHDRFDAVCDELTHGLEEAIDKLTKQESIWQQALDEVQNEIAGKADKVEMTPLTDFVNVKLKSLHEKLKSLTEMKKEVEAAGTKKLLRDVQCISCDKNVVMRVEEISKYRMDSFPCSSSIKPYLTYKLDQVRRQQKKLPRSRDMIQYEEAMQEEARKTKTEKEKVCVKPPRNHLCNRYCGGSHTVTTPQQRVTRTGHFLTEWGPEIIQLTDGLIRGKDGQMYHGRPMQPEMCGPVCSETQISMETPSSETSQEPVPVVSTTPRKSPQTRRRNGIRSQKRNLKKQFKEPNDKEESNVSEFDMMELKKPIINRKPIVEEQQLTSPEANDRIGSIGLTAPDEIVLYEADEETDREQIEE